MSTTVAEHFLTKERIIATIPASATTNVLHRLNHIPNQIRLQNASVNIADIGIGVATATAIPIANRNAAPQQIIIEVELFEGPIPDVGQTTSNYTVTPATHTFSDGVGNIIPVPELSKANPFYVKRFETTVPAGKADNTTHASFVADVSLVNAEVIGWHGAGGAHDKFFQNVAVAGDGKVTVTLSGNSTADAIFRIYLRCVA